MKKQVSKFTLALSLLASATGFSQVKQPVIPCATYEAMEQRFNGNPAARQQFEEAQKQLETSRLATENSAARPAAFEYTVPVVFHILHQGGPENISDAACFAALDQVNKDFARLSQDTNQIFSVFKSRYVDSEIRFMPAKRDPQGNCINGVVRHVDPKTNWSQSGAFQNSYWSYTWDPTRYLNIYIVGNIVPQGTVTGGGIIVGYTYIPGTWPTGNAHDAIVYRSSYLTTGFPNPNSRSLSHEIGHWLSLPHTFGNTNNPGIVCGDDNIADTPPTKGNFATCPVSSTNTLFTCSSPNPSNANNYFQNVENIMDYSSCPKNFTQGQTTAMRNTLAGTVANRQNLWSASNIIFTGINNTTPCAPVAEFLSSTGSYTVCAGGSLTMRDFSYSGIVTNYSWAADNNAMVVAPSSSQTAINFQIVGVTNVTLTVSNAQGSSSQVRQVYVMDATPALTGASFESFEDGLPPFWSIGDEQNDGKTWMHTNSASYDQSYSFYIDGGQMPPNTSDYLMLPMIDVKNNPGNKLDFAYAYRRMVNSQNDALKIQASRDCGGTWEDIFILSATAMAANSGGTSTDPFFPNSQEEWKTYVISDHPKWNNYTNSSSVLVRLMFIEGSNGFGNNLFVDAVNFYAPSGVNELTQKHEFTMYPNPSNGEAFVHFNLSTQAQVKLTVKDLLGRDVLTVADQLFPAGEQTLQIATEGSLKPGIYFVNMSVNGANMSHKMIVK
jgi:hypothetical protein